MRLTPGPFVSLRVSDLLPEHTHHTLDHTANVLDTHARTTNCLPARVMDPPNPTNVDLQDHNGATPQPGGSSTSEPALTIGPSASASGPT